MSFRITCAPGCGKARLDADARLLPEDFRAIAARLRQSPIRARKVGHVAARRASRRETVETRWNGHESTNVAEAGDWIVTNLSPRQEALRDRSGALNTYVVTAGRFPALYKPTAGRSQHGAVYRTAGGIVEAVRLPGGFDILAPWGERQRAAAGHLVLNGGEVYGINADAFKATYRELLWCRAWRLLRLP